MVGINIEALRFARAVQLVANAEALVKDQQLPGALLLYVTALEMIGWEVNLPLGIEEFGLQHKIRDKHRLRHFSAAALFVADCLLVLSNGVVTEVDFKRLTFERRPRATDQEPGVDWAPKASTQFMSILVAMVSPHFRLGGVNQESPQYIATMNLQVGMNVLGNAALGFLDNHRLALIHEDNAFNFVQYHANEPHSAGRLPLMPTTVVNYMNLLPRIIESAKNPAGVKLLGHHLRNMIISFKAPLIEKSYYR